MGTRADFYVGTGRQAEWIGSIAWDGHPEGIAAAVLHASTEGTFREATAAFLIPRDDATAPEMGWPWPWDDSRTTDYAYCFAQGEVICFNWGRRLPRQGDADDAWHDRTEPSPFPNMSARMNVAWGKRSGLLIFGGGPL